MIQFIGWYFAITFIGLLIFPITFRFLPKLHDRGYAFSRAIGLLLWGICFWSFSTFQILPNDLFGAIFAFFILLVISSLCLLKNRWKELIEWLHQNIRLVITVEVLFLVSFVLWAIVRSANPDVANTEKPMELAFINAILRSPRFPPNDPWLSGYSISYYYLGYVLIALLIRVTGVTSGVGYNLAGALWFALTAIGAFGVVYNIIHAFVKKSEGEGQHKKFSFSGLLGPFFVLIVSNLEGFLEVLHSMGLFWKTGSDGALQSKFWEWLGILDLNKAPTASPSIVPTRWMWWWRASRIVGQSDLLGNSKEIIDEFPFFSYLLADLHPHVLAMPFVMIAIVMALNFYLVAKQGNFLKFKIRDWIRTPGFWLTAIILGSLGFLNTWNFPIYVAFFSAAFALARYQQLGEFWRRLWDFLRIFLLLAIAGIILYIPFYISFQSQAGGVLPSLEFFTRNIHFWLMFAPLLIPIFAWLDWEACNKKNKPYWKSGITFTVVILLLLFFGSWLLGWLLSSFPIWTASWQKSSSDLLVKLSQRFAGIGTEFSYIHGLVPQGSLLIGSLLERIKAPGTILSLGFLIVLVWSLLSRRSEKPENDRDIVEKVNNSDTVSSHGENGFILLLIFLGAGLTLIPEFFYLKDQFGWPINTYFKFYFEAWIFWGLAAAVASYILFTKLKKMKLVAFSVGWAVVICMSLVYPIFSVYTKTNNFNPEKFTLDGLYYRQKSDADEAAAIEWLKQAEYGVIAEAVGGEYSNYARVSTETGLPSVLGWPGHEIQWRGGTTEIGTRETDIQTIYQSNDWSAIEALLKQYNIRYIFVGLPEKQKYSPDDLSAQNMMQKFEDHLAVVFKNSTITIFEYQSEGLDGTANSSGVKQ
jgi:uncharacterized membrane protein